MGVRGWIIRGIVVGLILAVCAGGWCLYIGIATSLRAERALHAILLVTTVVERHVDQTGQWPRSWEELQAVPGDDLRGMYSWPEDSAEVQRYVAVDFDAELSAIASQSVEEFHAIRAIGPHYPPDEGFVTELIKTVRERVAEGRAK